MQLKALFVEGTVVQLFMSLGAFILTEGYNRDEGYMLLF